MLKKTFFLPPSPADLRDIESTFYPSPHACPMEITKQKVLKAIRRPKADKALGLDGISNRILKACSKKLLESLTPLYQACVRLTYHPYAFKTAHTIIIKKPGKDVKDYVNLKAYKPIALLNTLSKTLESIMAEKISYLAERFNLLPCTQIGACQGRSTKTALELLTEQVYTVWGQGRDKVATLFSMDIAGAFDTVSY